MSFIDTHCHLKSFLEKNILDEVLNRARSVGVDALITIGTNKSDWDCYQKLARKHKNIFFTVGLHPCYVDQNWRDNIDSIFEYWNTHDKPSAFGEIGLDYFHLPNDKSKASEIIKEQQQCFIAQLELAKSLNCSVVIHSRNSFDDCVKFIDRSGVDWQKVVFHCFSEGISEVTKLNQRKGRASFTGNVTYSKNPKMVEVIKAQGIDLLMLETDSPYLSPEPNRRSINEPYRINDIFEFISLHLDYKPNDLRDAIFRNATKFFKLNLSSND